MKISNNFHFICAYLAFLKNNKLLDLLQIKVFTKNLKQVHTTRQVGIQRDEVDTYSKFMLVILKKKSQNEKMHLLLVVSVSSSG